MTDIDVAALRVKHYEIVWFEGGDDGLPDLEKPLGSFCAACTDEEYVGAVEFGDMIDAAADVVSWPCDLVRLLDALAAERSLREAAEGEVARLRDAAEVDDSLLRSVIAAREHVDRVRDAARADLEAAEGERIALAIEAERDRLRQKYDSWLFTYGSAVEPGSRDLGLETAMDTLDVAARIARETT